MKARDEVLWERARSEMRASGEVGEHFLGFVEFWTEAAETLLAERPEDLSATDALRVAYEMTEQQLGSVSVHYLGQMMIVIASNWVHGEVYVHGLTSLELKLIAEAVKGKIADQQAQAATAAEPEP